VHKATPKTATHSMCTQQHRNHTPLRVCATRRPKTKRGDSTCKLSQRLASILTQRHTIHLYHDESPYPHDTLHRQHDELTGSTLYFFKAPAPLRSFNKPRSLLLSPCTTITAETCTDLAPQTNVCC